VRWERAIRPTISRRRAAAQGRVLCYHSVGTPEWGVNDVLPGQFRAHMELALSLGYGFVAAADIASGHASQRDLAVTFDDGLRSVNENAASVLAELGIPWTVFVVCGWADGEQAQRALLMDWQDVRQAARLGAEIGSHSMTHPDFSALSDDEAGSELFESRRVIREQTGILVDSFAIPFGQSRNWRPSLSRLARSCGYEHVYAQAIDTRTEGTIARTFITRFDGGRTFRAALEGAFDAWEEPA
jgi:peptidoglycan/xylan/chitin deacetylase (PgdA/CDA1 family)